LAAYHVSGEFMMIKAAGKLGLLDADQAMLGNRSPNPIFLA
jgi:delta-aminolevulinic acid dehydratase/porphobilinogen synthase